MLYRIYCAFEFPLLELYSRHGYRAGGEEGEKMNDCEIDVGIPGRINDWMEEHILKTDSVSYVALDVVDLKNWVKTKCVLSCLLLMGYSDKQTQLVE